MCDRRDDDGLGLVTAGFIWAAVVIVVVLIALAMPTRRVPSAELCRAQGLPADCGRWR